MTYTLQFFGATEQVTGSLYLLRTAEHTVMLECGLIQGGRAAEARNQGPFPVTVDEIDVVVIRGAHFDHSGRIGPANAIEFPVIQCAETPGE